MSANTECVKNIVTAKVLGYLLSALQALQQCQVLILDTISALISSPIIVEEALVKGSFEWWILNSEIRERFSGEVTKRKTSIIKQREQTLISNGLYQRNTMI